MGRLKDLKFFLGFISTILAFAVVFLNDKCVNGEKIAANFNVQGSAVSRPLEKEMDSLSPWGEDYLKMCLTFQCHRVRSHRKWYRFWDLKRQYSMNLNSGLEKLVECGDCKGLLRKGKVFGTPAVCTPIEQGGTFKTPKSWVTLATASVALESTLKRRDSMIVPLRNWKTFEKGKGYAVGSGIDLSGCATKNSERTFIEVSVVFLISNIGSVDTSVKRSRKWFGLSDDSLNISIKTFNRMYDSKENSQPSRTRLPKRWNLSRGHTAIYTSMDTIHLGYSTILNPDDLAEVILSCNNRMYNCDLTHYISCANIMCRAVSPMELALEAVEHSVDKYVLNRLMGSKVVPKNNDNRKEFDRRLVSKKLATENGGSKFQTANKMKKFNKVREINKVKIPIESPVDENAGDSEIEDESETVEEDDDDDNDDDDNDNDDNDNDDDDDGDDDDSDNSVSIYEKDALKKLNKSKNWDKKKSYNKKSYNKMPERRRNRRSLTYKKGDYYLENNNSPYLNYVFVPHDPKQKILGLDMQSNGKFESKNINEKGGGYINHQNDFDAHTIDNDLNMGKFLREYILKEKSQGKSSSTDSTNLSLDEYMKTLDINISNANEKVSTEVYEDNDSDSSDTSDESESSEFSDSVAYSSDHIENGKFKNYRNVYRKRENLPDKYNHFIPDSMWLGHTTLYVVLGIFGLLLLLLIICSFVQFCRREDNGRRNISYGIRNHQRYHH